MDRMEAIVWVRSVCSGRVRIRNTQIKYADPFDRLLLILKLVYLLLIGLGLDARRRFPPGAWCSSNRPRQCSDFTIEQRMLLELQVEPRRHLGGRTKLAMSQGTSRWES